MAIITRSLGNGFATEGALTCIYFAFTTLNLPQVYAIAPELNKKSQKVMQKNGMHEYAHFEHPKIDEKNPLHSCVAYRISQNQL